MSRFYAPISKSDFQEKLVAVAKKVAAEEYDVEEIEEATPRDLISMAFKVNNLTAKVSGDISKIDFSLENCYCYPEDLDFHDDPNEARFVGFKTLPNGMEYLGIYAGGDWELPVHFIVYWSGKEFRAYVPTDGNTFNEKTKTAYGSEPNIALDHTFQVPEQDRRKFDYDALIADIQSRILCK